MKRYFVFIISFGLLYIVFEIVSGMVLTLMYTPDISSAGEGLSQEVSFGNHSIFPILMGFVAATLAFFISQNACKASRKSSE